MITADLTGNIGDHLKIYALTRTIAEKNGYKWGFNPTPSHDYYGGMEQMAFMDIDYGIKHSSPWGTLLPETKTVISEPIVSIYPDGHFVNYHPYCPSLFDIEDNTKLVVNCAQNFKYYEGKKKDIEKWFKIKTKCRQDFEKTIVEQGIVLDENLCVLNARGGEYLGVKDFSLPKNYWLNGIQKMLEKNSKMQFICITDDVNYYKNWFSFPVMHFSIGCDYFIINNAKNLIISNSAFGMFPTWLNSFNPYVIAPLYWARYNISNGYWAYSEINIPEWNWMDRGGNFVSI